MAREPLWQHIGKYVKLTRAGHWYMGLCPFHDDHDPSFAVGDVIYKCLACGATGTRKMWDQHFGNRTPITTAPNLLQTAKKPGGLSYPKEWVGHPKALAYFQARGLREDTIYKRNLGYNGWRFTIPLMEGTRLRGIKFRRDDNNYADMGPKYYFAPGSKRILVNRDVLTKSREIVICEGEIDCFLLDQLDIPVVTASNGCESFDINWLGWFREKVVYLCLDEDKAGRIAEEKLYVQMTYFGAAMGIVVKVIRGLKAKDIGEWWLKRSR